MSLSEPGLGFLSTWCWRGFKPPAYLRHAATCRCTGQRLAHPRPVRWQPRLGCPLQRSGFYRSGRRGVHLGRADDLAQAYSAEGSRSDSCGTPRKVLRWRMWEVKRDGCWNVARRAGCVRVSPLLGYASAHVWSNVPMSVALSAGNRACNVSSSNPWSCRGTRTADATAAPRRVSVRKSAAAEGRRGRVEAEFAGAYRWRWAPTSTSGFVGSHWA